MNAPDLPHSTSFAWPETGERVEDLLGRGPLTVDPTGRWYEQYDGDDLVAALRPPLVLVDAAGLQPAEQMIERADTGPGRYAVLLLQAGAAALGLFEDDEVLDHKAQKRYVVRGKGRAQPSHLRAKGKSRQGSRLRLRNAERLLQDVSERLGAWWADSPEPSRLYLSCPVRLFADLSRSDPTPPVLSGDARVVRIPLDVNVPTHAELLRVHRSIGRGRQWSLDD